MHNLVAHHVANARSDKAIRLTRLQQRVEESFADRLYNTNHGRWTEEESIQQYKNVSSMIEGRK